MKLRRKKLKRSGKVTAGEVTTYRGPKGGKLIGCLLCHADVAVDRGTSAAVCGTCMSRVIPGPVQKPVKTDTPKLTKSGKPRAKRGTAVKKQPSGVPRGWHFMKLYIHTDGQAYSRKVPITPEQAKKLAKKLGVKLGGK